MDCIHQIDAKKLPLRENQNVDQFMIEIAPVIFDPGVCQSVAYKAVTVI